MKITNLVTALALTAACSLPASAAILQLDFGPTDVGASLTKNSPYHTVSGSTADETWNKVETADVASGLSYSDGTAATGVSLNLGVSANGATIDFANSPGSSSALGTTVNTGVYAAGSVGRDGIFSGSGTQDNRLGLQITGLAAGIYDIYVVAINSNQPNSRPMNVGAVASTGFATWDTTALASASMSNDATDTSAWVAGTNYAKLTVTLDGTNNVLSLFTDGTNSTEQRGFLNSVQVALIPEPASLALMGLGGLLMLGRSRRA